MSDADQWNQQVSHRVLAHGADPGQLLGYVSLGEIQWAHFDTHAALTAAGLRPPDGHGHPVRADMWPPMTIPGLAAPLSQARALAGASSYRPFPGSPKARAGPFEHFGSPPLPEDTSLPQTGLCPATGAGLTDWASGSMRVLDEICTKYEGDPSVLSRAGTFELRHEMIRQFAGTAAARWQPPACDRGRGRRGKAGVRDRSPRLAG